MEKHNVKIKSIHYTTHDVMRIVTEKPQGYSFLPGQATDVAVNKEGWQNELRPFTFTSLPQNDYIEFTIKTYPSHQGVTNQLLKAKVDDELILHEVFGTISYKGEGVFIAGGAGVTPFICILRHLQSENKIGANKLIFANKTKEDIILEQEFRNILGVKFINILSDEEIPGYAHGQITEDFLKINASSINQYFYICGPPLMMGAVERQLMQLHVNKSNIVKEDF